MRRQSIERIVLFLVIRLSGLGSVLSYAAMAQIDHERERQRLAQVYAGMSDQQLTELSQDAQSLTDDAKHTLGAELSRRGLRSELAEPTDALGMAPAAGEPDSKIVTLRRFLYVQAHW